MLRVSLIRLRRPMSCTAGSSIIIVSVYVPLEEPTLMDPYNPLCTEGEAARVYPSDEAHNDI